MLLLEVLFCCSVEMPQFLTLCAHKEEACFSLFWRVCGNHAENEKYVFEKHCKICVILLAAEAKVFQKSTQPMVGMCRTLQTMFNCFIECWPGYMLPSQALDIL